MSDHALVNIYTMYTATAVEGLLRPSRLAMAFCRAALSALLRGAEELACRVMLRGMVADGAGAGATSAAQAWLLHTWQQPTCKQCECCSWRKSGQLVCLCSGQRQALLPCKLTDLSVKQRARAGCQPALACIVYRAELPDRLA